MARVPGDAWTREQVMQLEDLIERGFSYAEIGRRMGRTENAINVARKRYGIRARTKTMHTGTGLARLFGFADARAVTRWVRCGWLIGKLGGGPKRPALVKHEDVLSFMECERYWHLWAPERITDAGLRAWALELRAGDAWLTTGEVARRLHVDHATVQSWIVRGELKARRNPNWLVRARDLEGFVVPADRPRRNAPIRRFSAEEDRVLLDRRASGATWWEIGRELGRNASSVQGRYLRLQAHASAERQEVAA